MAKWKYTGDRQQYTARFLRFEEGKEKEIEVSDWSFHKTAPLFKCYVIKEDGKEIDLIWTVWDYESAQKLKKKLGVKYVTGSKVLKVTMRKDEDDETFFDIK